MLSVTNLTKTFQISRTETFTAVNNISFKLKQGEILGILGANGAGKTTTIQMLLSTLKPTSGSIEYFGRDLAQDRSAIMEKVGFASTYVELPPRLTVYRNLAFYAEIYGMNPTTTRRDIMHLLDFFGITQLENQEFGSLSAGQKTRVMLVKAFMMKPAIVLLDEPTASLDPDIAQQVRAFIKEERQTRGISVLLTSHNMQEVAEICDRIIVMQQGTIVTTDTPANLARSTQVSRLQLTVVQKLPELLLLCERHGGKTNVQGTLVTILIDMTQIPELLHDIAHEDIKYTNITVQEPSLEEYFLQLVRSTRITKA